MTSNPASVGPAPDGEGWIEWSGGENPVPGCMVEVKIRWREGESSEGCCTSETFDWSHRRKGRGEGGDIIAYRIAPGGVERKNIERAGLWANLPDGRPVGRMEPLDAFEAGKRAATDAILSALSVSPPVVEGGLGALRASPCVPTEGHEATVVADDGWVHAPEGGWPENPVPGRKVYWRCDRIDGFHGFHLSDDLVWGGHAPIIAYRFDREPVR